MKIRTVLYTLFLVLVPYTAAHAVDPVVAIPQFTIDTMEHKERVTTQTLTAVGPGGVSQYKEKSTKDMGLVLNETELPALTDVFIRHLVATSKFRVVERSKVDRIMGEIAMGEQGLIDKESMIKKGTLLGAEYIVIGTLVYIDANITYEPIAYTHRFSRTQNGTMRVNMRIIHSPTGHIKYAWISQGRVDKKEMVPSRGSTIPDREFYQELMEDLACNLTSKMVGYMSPSTKGPQ
ncbi:MAG: CsgG/HfaB family protein [Thermodesulfobacteriota bacterium]|nr:CsgG/HfaB family protein [Thermodesulfobacteriota bacterium]